MPVSLEYALRACALCAAATVVAMITIFLVTGVGQDPLQYIHPVTEYGQILARNPPVLRAAIGLDDGFIVFYTSAFVLLATRLWRDGGPRVLVSVSLGLLLLLALLDMVENFHFLAMIARAELAILPTDGEIEAQVWESLLKFHVGYVGLFLLAFALPRDNPYGRWMANLGWFVQMPVGVLIYVTPRAVALPLVFVRFGYFLAALLLLSKLYPPVTASGASDSPSPG